MAPRSPEANAQIRARQRANLAAAASRVFARKGFHGTRVSDIVREAEVSQGLLHQYFESKEGLFNELIENLMSMAVQVPALAAVQPGTPLDRLRWYLSISLTGLVQNPDAALLASHARRDDAPEQARARVEEAGHDSVQALCDLVSAAQESGELVAGDPLLLATHLIAVTQGFAFIAATGPLPPGAPDLELVLGGFLQRDDPGESP